MTTPPISARRSWARGLSAWVLALAAGLLSLPAGAALIQAGTLVATVPSGLHDPLGTLVLPADALLVPIEITGAVGLQDWQFDLAFAGSVVQPLDLFGLTQWAYQAAFSATDASLSSITASGLALTDLLDGVAGFSSGVSGDGVLAYVLFQYQSGQVGNDPGFEVGDGQVTQVPEPGSLALLTLGVLAAGATWRRPARQ